MKSEYLFTLSDKEDCRSPLVTVTSTNTFLLSMLSMRSGVSVLDRPDSVTAVIAVSLLVMSLVIGDGAEYTSQEYRNDLIGVKHMLNKDHGLEAYLVTAPTPKKMTC